MPSPNISVYVSAYQWQYPGILETNTTSDKVPSIHRYYLIRESSDDQRGVESVIGRDEAAVTGSPSYPGLGEPPEIALPPASPLSVSQSSSIQILVDSPVNDVSSSSERSSILPSRYLRIPASPISCTTPIETLTDSEPSSPVVPLRGFGHTALPFAATTAQPPPTIGTSLTPEEFQREAFTARSAHPDPVLRMILDRVLRSFFFLSGIEEPDIESEEGMALCAPNTLGLIFAPSEERGELPIHGSVYLKFVDLETGKCLVCGNHRTSLEGLLECVRVDLGHLPYRCAGVDIGCTACGPMTTGFASKRQLDLHIQQHAAFIARPNLL